MSSFEVVVADVFGDFFQRNLDALVFGHFEFVLEGSEEAFHECVVITVVGSAHALSDAGATQNGSVVVTGVLAASIGVVNDSFGRLPFFDG